MLRFPREQAPKGTRLPGGWIGSQEIETTSDGRDRLRSLMAPTRGARGLCVSIRAFRIAGTLETLRQHCSYSFSCPMQCCLSTVRLIALLTTTHALKRRSPRKLITADTAHHNHLYHTLPASQFDFSASQPHQGQPASRFLSRRAPPASPSRNDFQAICLISDVL